MSEAGSSHRLKRASRRPTAVLALVAAALLVAAVGPLVTPDAPSAGDPDAIDMAAARAHVAAVASAAHPMGSAEIARVRQYLLAELAGMGLEPVTQAAQAPDYYGTSGGTVDLANVMARIAGTGDGDAIAFIAHYDTVPTTPGANDNTAAVAALLESARVLVREDRLRNDLIILFTDGEEPAPRYGASTFKQHPWFGDVKLAVNFEGIGEGGPATLVELSGPRRWLIAELFAAVDGAVANSFMTETADLIGGAASDFDVFRGAGIPGLNFAFFRGSAIYHTADDDPARLHHDGLAHQGALALGIARHFGHLVLDDAQPDSDVAFFVAPGGVRVHHRTGVLWLVLAIGVLLSVFGLVRRRRSIPERGSPLRGLCLVFAGSLVAAGAATIPWLVVVGLRPHMGVAESYAYLAALVILVAGVWAGVRRLARAWAADAVAGSVALWVLMAVAAVAAAPALGYFLAWGLLAGGAALAFCGPHGGRLGHRVAALVVVAFPVLVLCAPVIDTFFLMAGPRPGNPHSELPSTVAVSLFVTYLVMALVAAVVGWWGKAGPGPTCD